MDLESVGPYRVVATVSSDRRTVTVRARRGRDPTVLVKTVKPGLASTAPAARALEREADLLLALRHPGWPTLIEVLRDGPTPALVFVDHGGERLDAVLARAGALEPASAVAVAIAIAQAAAAFHRAGGAHGALQPALVELTAQGGICLHGPLVPSDGPVDLSEPEHMAPEQLLGEAADVRSDVFLLGGLLYRMLTGRAPFAGDAEGISQRIRHHEPPPVRRAAPSVPHAVESVVARCLAKRRHDRFPDMVSLAARLTAELRRETSLPSDLLIARALAKAGLAEGLPAPAEAGLERGSATPRERLLRRAGPFVAALFVMLLALLGRRAIRADLPEGTAGPRGILEAPGHVRVLARPWAEVLLDGQRIDVTPRAAPIDAPPGRHTFVFRHPAAADETRTVELVSGQTVLLDVEMGVKLAPPPGASAAPSASADESP